MSDTSRYSFTGMLTKEDLLKLDPAKECKAPECGHEEAMKGKAECDYGCSADSYYMSCKKHEDLRPEDFPKEYKPQGPVSNLFREGDGILDYLRRTSPTEKRHTDPDTGGQKGEKPQAYALIPSHPLEQLSYVYGMGSKKYEPWNWAKGYAWSLSLSALFRHIEAFRRGESKDESGFHHLAHAAFHLFTLMEYDRLGLGKDDRWTK